MHKQLVPNSKLDKLLPMLHGQTLMLANQMSLLRSGKLKVLSRTKSMLNGLNWRQNLMLFTLDIRLSIETTAHIKQSEQALIEELIASSEVLLRARKLMKKLLRNVSSNTKLK